MSETEGGLEPNARCPNCGFEPDPGAGAANFCPKCGMNRRKGATRNVAHPLIGAVVADRYKLLALLGEGGMGSVFKAEHVRMGKVLAVKILRGDFAKDEEAVRRFSDEAQLVSRLSHPHTIAVFDFGEIGFVDGLYLAMEYVPGKDLATILRRDKVLPVPRVVTIGQQLLGSLAEAHDAGIVHRDVKPGNVMVMRTRTGDDFAKVLDFGIAKLRDEGTSSVTSDGEIVGTPNYLAPEQARGRDVDARADIYAAGCVLFEALAGRPPFVAGNPIAVVNAHLSTPAPPLADYAPDVPAPIAAVVARALEKDPAARYRSADEMRAALLDAGELSGPSTPRRPYAPEVTGELEIASRDDFADFERQLRSLKRSRIVAPLAVALLVAAAGLIAWRWTEVYSLLARRTPGVAGSLPAGLRPANLYDGVEHEPNDSPQQANPLPLPPGADGRAGRGVAVMRGHVGARISDTTGDIDVFRIEVPDGIGPAILVAEWSGERKGEGIRGLDVALTLNRQREEGGRSTAPLVANVDHGGPGRPETLAAPAEPGVYYLAVRERHATDAVPVEKPTDGYVLEVRLAEPKAGEEVEPNDRPDAVSNRFVRYAEWASLAARNPLSAGTATRGETSREDPDTYAVLPGKDGERPALVAILPAAGLAVSALTWTPDDEDLGPSKPTDRIRFAKAGVGSPGQPLLVPIAPPPRAGAPVLLQLRAERGAGRYAAVALGPGAASARAAVALSEELAKEGRAQAARELLDGYARAFPDTTAQGELGGAGERVAEQASLHAIGHAKPCTPDAVAKRAVDFLVAHPASAGAQEARLWQARALEESFWRTRSRALSARAVAAYKAAAELSGSGKAEAEERVKALEARVPSRKGAVPVCR
jgi:serine/threonine protein kinase